MSLVRRYPLTALFVLACALSWWPWILYSVGLSPNPIVGFGPFLAALVVLAVTEGKSGVMGLLRRMVRHSPEPSPPQFTAGFAGALVKP